VVNHDDVQVSPFLRRDTFALRHCIQSARYAKMLNLYNCILQFLARELSPDLLTGSDTPIRFAATGVLPQSA
jgi:hypothetical protein